MYIVVNIGCIECGVSSNIVGVFSDENNAKAIAEQCEKDFYWREGGQNAFEVFALPEPELINDEYKSETVVS